MSKEYYFLATLLPSLEIGQTPEISIESYNDLLEKNLTEPDLEKIKRLRLYFDLENIRLFWSGKPVTVYGNLDKNALEEALLSGQGLPGYVYNFMDSYAENKRVSHFGQLFAQYFQDQKDSKFQKDARNIRLVLAALRCKKFGRPLLPELQYEDLEDDLTEFLLAQKDGKTIELTSDYVELKTIYESLSDLPLELHRAILSYRFRKIEEVIGLQIFTIDRLLGYYMQLVFADQWILLNKEKGTEIINTIVQGT